MRVLQRENNRTRQMKAAGVEGEIGSRSANRATWIQSWVGEAECYQWWWNTADCGNEIFMNGEMLLHSAVQHRGMGNFKHTVIAKPSINYREQAVMPVAMTTGSPMYFAPFEGGKEGAASIYWSTLCFLFLLQLFMVPVPACDYMVNFHNKIIKCVSAKI